MFGWVGEVSAVSETAGDTRRRRTASGTSSCRYCQLTVLRSPRSCYAVGICYCHLTVLRSPRSCYAVGICRYCHLTVLRSPRSCYAVGICRYCDLTVLRSPRSWYAVFVLFLPTTHYPPLLTL